MYKIKKMAKKFRSKMGNKITVDKLSEYVYNKGWDLQYLHQGETNAYITLLKLEEFAKNKESFFVNTQAYTVIFVNDGYDQKHKAFLILHEICHLLLKHNGNLTPYQERQASVFAEECIKKPLLPMRVKIAVGASFALLAAAFLIYISFQHSFILSSLSANNGRGNSKETDNLGTITKEDYGTVFLTGGGEKYHKSSCIYIRNRKDVVVMSLEESIKLGRKPCSVCMP